MKNLSKYSFIFLVSCLSSFCFAQTSDKTQLAPDFSSLFSSIEVRNFEYQSLYVESLDTIVSENYVFYIIYASDSISNKFKIMSYEDKDYLPTSDCNQIRVYQTYNFNLVTWFFTTYRNELEGFVIDNIEFCRDDIYDDIYGSLNIEGLCITNAK